MTAAISHPILKAHGFRLHSSYVKLLIFLFLFSPFVKNYAQTPSKITFYFENNQFQTPVSSTQLDSIQKWVNSCDSVQVMASTDYKASSAYNYRLAQKRAAFATQLLQRYRSTHAFKTVTKTLGEITPQTDTNLVQTGIPEHRKTEVLFYFPSKAKQTENKKNWDISTLKTGDQFELKGLSFIPGRHFLLPGTEQILSELITFMKDHPQVKIEIQGHICCEYEYADGLDFDTKKKELSLNRAKFVYEELVKNGISTDRMTYKGYGHQFPKVKEITREDEQKNRRVEIKILEK